jgi:hypothetical protein
MKFRGSNRKKIREANRVRVATLDTIMAEVHQGTTIDTFLEKQTQTKQETPKGEDKNQDQQEPPAADPEGNEPAAAEPRELEREEETHSSSPKRSKGFSAGLRQMFQQKPEGSDK